MKTTDEQFIKMNETILELAQTLAQTEARHEKTMRRQHWLLLGVVILFTLVFYTSKEPDSNAFAQMPLQSAPATAPLSPQARAAKRKALTEQLPVETKQRLESFEQKVNWVSQYMGTWDAGMEGAVVALMLHNMSTSMEAVPEMLEQMKVMNSFMNAMPVIANEMQRINANMSMITFYMNVMTHDMDSTMGRMGRAMPW